MSRTILITGGSGKFGRVLVRHFLAMGNNVIATCYSDASRVHLQHDYGDSVEGRFCVIQVDFSQAGQSEQLVARLQKLGLIPDYLINNARSVEYLVMKDNGRVSRANFVGELILDVVAPYELTMELVDVQGSRLQRVVNIGSMYGLVAANPSLYTDPTHQSPIHYGVAKAALVHLTKELAVRLAVHGVDVNCVAYGGVEGRVDQGFKARYEKLCPMGRMLREDEIVGPVAWLLSSGCSGMTGHTLTIDGGWSVW